jgi:SAM-dependent methyltransferase
MGSARLVQHYDEKYAGEATQAARPSVVARPHPGDRFEACLTHLSPHLRGGDILELASGDGVLLRSLIGAGVDFDTLTATDFSPVRLEGLARSVDDPRVRLAQLDADALGDWDGGPFDAVIAIALVEHLIDPIGALRAVRELLRPGGVAYIDTPNAAKWTRRLKLAAGRFPSTASLDEGLTGYDGSPTDLLDEGHLHYFTYRSLSRILVERCGFSRVEKLGYVYGGQRLGGLPDLLARSWPEMFGELAVVAFA